VLEFAVLGLLRESPMHGYELRKRLNTSLGVFRAFSYGSLYPCLKSLVQRGLLTEEDGAGAAPGRTPGGSPGSAAPAEAPQGDRRGTQKGAPGAAPLPVGRRARIVYRLTAEGRAYFGELLSQSGPEDWEDEHFGVRFAFFGQTSRDVRMRVLEGRRSRLEERLARMRASLARGRGRLDGYTYELQRHGVESVEREVRWLSELIESERAGRTGGGTGDGAQQAGPQPPAEADGPQRRPARPRPPGEPSEDTD